MSLYGSVPFHFKCEIFFVEKFLREDSQYPDYEFKKLSPYNDFPGLTEFLAHWEIID